MTETENPIRNEIGKVLFLLTYVLIFILLGITAAFVYLKPEDLQLINISLNTGKVIIMIEIALLLLITSWQNVYSKSYRIFSGIGGTLVLAESIFMYFRG
ncbi:MAG: hypothetical protein K6G50_10725 [bacterium]|nr:hypothetical protein [bacterium]